VHVVPAAQPDGHMASDVGDTPGTKHVGPTEHEPVENEPPVITPPVSHHTQFEFPLHALHVLSPPQTWFRSYVHNDAFAAADCRRLHDEFDGMHAWSAPWVSRVIPSAQNWHPAVATQLEQVKEEGHWA